MPSLCSVILAASAPLGAGCEEATGTSNPYAGHRSDVYADPAHWLCHPALDAADDVCHRNLDATIVHPDGATAIEPHATALEPPVDCFYVYPTISFDVGGNADLVANTEEIFITLTQAARYSAVCRMYVPIYRQVTVPALLFGDDAADWELAYGDVLDAFRHYIANDNRDRGYLLLGHSQGAFHLRRLIQEEVEASPYLADRLVAAHLLGATVAVPTGQDVGGSFQRTPLCRAPDQAGCVVTYASFRATEPPGPEALFGATDDPATEAACTNPAALAGGLVALDSYLPTAWPPNLAPFIANPGPFAAPGLHPPVDTLFFKLPGMVTGQCVERGGSHYLEVVVTADASDPRADDIGGDLAEGWGLHMNDYALTLGDLVPLAQRQADAWLAVD